VQSILDILITEVASILGISREDVLSRFTEEELDELLNNSLCTPVETVGGDFGDISALPCQPPSPEFLPEVDLGVDNILNQINDKKNDKTKKCIGAVEEVNRKVNDQTKKYNQYKILLDKLIEYRDNYIPIKYYFEEKSREAARILGIFSALLTERNRLFDSNISLNREISDIRSKLAIATVNQDYELVGKLQETYNDLNRQKTNNFIDLNSINSQLIEQEDSIPILNNELFQKLSNLDASSPRFASILGSITSNFIDSSTFSSIKSSIENYSETIEVGKSNRAPANIQDAISNKYITFNISFPSLEYLDLEEEKYDESTGNTTIVKTKFYIKTSNLLEKDSFFKNSDRVSIGQFNNTARLPNGSLYTQYYNLFEDPINNFFQLSERGLTENEQLIDSRVKGTDAEVKKENGKQYFVENIDVLQNFYQNFEESLNVRTREVKEQRVAPIQNRIKEIMKTIARKEIQLILALGGVNKKLPSQSQFLNTISSRLEEESVKYATGVRDLDGEISRIEALLREIKPNPDNVKRLLKESDEECFKDIDRPTNPCAEVLAKLGSDPFGVKTIRSGVDPSLPNQNQLCYWLEFSKILNLVGLLPIPNLPNVTQLRYWPVGLVLTTPTGLVKIPLPIIYLPLIVISTPLGNIVFFLTINGLFISPMVFFASSSGFKQFIITAKGSSEKFGYDKDDASIKSNLQVPVVVSAALEKAKKLTQELINGKYYNLSEDEKNNYLRSKKILEAKIEDFEKSGNTIGKEKAQLKLKQLEESSQNKGFFEKLEEFLNKQDSPLDLISDFKKSINKSLNRQGDPAFTKSQEKKQKIQSERQKQRAEMRKAMIDGNINKVKELRAKIKEEAVDLQEKVDALKEDLIEYFNKIKFPVVRIPKNKAAIDPKQNSIISFVEDLIDFSEIYGTQFFSFEDKKVGKQFLKEIAAANDELNEFISENLNINETINIEKEAKKIKDLFKGLTDIIIDRLKGKDNSEEIEEIKKQIAELTAIEENQTDRVEKRKTLQKIRRLQNKLNSLNGVYLNYLKNSLNAATLSGFNAIGIDFNPFSSCCTKPPFVANVEVGDAVAVLNLVKIAIFAIIDNYDEDQLTRLFSGKKEITSIEIKTKFTGLIKKIPEELELPIPQFDVAKFLEICSKLFLPLFEIKAAILAAQPALPLSITIDLNILKQPLLELLLSFLKAALPDPNKISTAGDSFLRSNQGGINFSNQTGSSINSSLQSPNGSGNFDRELNIVDCSSPGENSNQKSNLSSGPLSDFVSSSPKRNPFPDPADQVSNIYVASSSSVYPAFQNISNRFIDINPEDLLSLLVDFFNLNLDKLADILNPLYSLLNIVKPTRFTNLNVVEDAQYKVPPYGPPNEVRFTLITKLKQALPNATNFKITSLELLEKALSLVEEVLTPIASTPLPAILVGGAGALDSILPQIKLPVLDSTTGTISTQDLKINKLALRQLHPLLNQDDLPPWERLSIKNILFLLFLDDLASSAADQTGFFRSFI
jgi:hypothetical protein